MTSNQPICLYCGFFEVYTESGRYLGLFFQLPEAFDWVKRQPIGTRYRLVHRGPDMVRGGVFISFRCWIMAMGGEKVYSRPVLSFAGKGGAL